MIRKLRGLVGACAVICTSLGWADDCAPETWFHIIGGNASKEGLAADIAALKEAGIGGIQLFHGHADGSLWPGVTEAIPCLSEKWTDLIKFAETECHRQGLSFKMQNCPGWSMSGGPWITPDKAMRKLVCFEPGKKPAFDADDDYHEIGVVTFPVEDSVNSGWFSATFPNPSQINHHWAYEPDAKLMIWDGGYPNGKPVIVRECPMGAWQDEARMTISFPSFALSGWARTLAVESSHGGHRKVDGAFSTEHRLDMWEAKAGWALRGFTMSTDATPVKAVGTKTLVFGHVNAKRRNHPAPPEGTGWECDKMDPRGFEANWNGYLGKLLKAGVKIDGTLVDSWECGCQTWTWKMEAEFEQRNGYALRPWLPALFGYVLKSEAETEKFLLDWRTTCSRLVEENYYGTMARLAHENGMMVQFETAFGDVLPGDPLRYWKFADEPMCEFWSPFDNDRGFVTSHAFKPVRPCVSAAHLYGKRRVSAEAFTSFDLTFNESMQEWKENANRHFARGVTHLVFHTYTHNPVENGLPPGSSFGQKIGTPFLRRQTWWPFMSGFTKYVADCGRELEKGVPVVDILRYLGDAVSHRPDEHGDLFDNGYKYDYLNGDVLKTLRVVDGRLVPAANPGIAYRVLWIPEGTYLLSETEHRLAELARQGARIVRGDFVPDWPAQLTGGDVFWYERRDGDDVSYFVAAKEKGFKGRLALRDLGGSVELDLARGESRFVRKADLAVRPVARREIRPLTDWSLPLGAWKDLAGTPEEKAFSGTRAYETRFARPQGEDRVELDLGRVAQWARVTLNGKPVADLWCEPYRCDLTPYLVDGENELCVEVTSTWYNRLVYDAGQPVEKRQTWTIAGPAASAPLADSGLIGPVRLRRLVAFDGETVDSRVRTWINPVRVVAEAGAAKTERLLVPKRGQVSEGFFASSTGTELVGTNAWFILDFGKELHGGVQLGISPSTTKGAKVRLRFGESVSETLTTAGEGTATNDHAMRDFEIAVPWFGQIEVGNTGYRFLRIDLVSGKKVGFEFVRAVSLMRPMKAVGSFRCSDDRLNRVYETAVRTVHLCCQDYLWDGIKRDRLVWMGDTHPETMTILKVFGAAEILPESLDYMAAVTPPDKWMNTMPTYTLWWIRNLAEWYRYTGDRAYLAKHGDYLERTFDHVLTGVRDGQWLAGTFLDWPTHDDPAAERAGTQGLALIAALADKAHGLARTLEKLRPDPKGVKAAASLLALSGLRDPKEMYAQSLGLNGHAGVSTFYGYYMLEAMSAANENRRALDTVRDYWGAMLDVGATSFWEDFDLAWTNNCFRIDRMPVSGKRDIHGDYGKYCYKGFRHSFCHGWSAGPAAWCISHVLGIRPLDVGCRTVEVKPFLGDLDWAEGAMALPGGKRLSVRVDKGADGRPVLTVHAPDGVKVVR